MLEAADPDMSAGGGRNQSLERRSLAAVRAQLNEVARLLPAYRERRHGGCRTGSSGSWSSPPSQCRSTRRASSGSSTLASCLPLKNSSTTARSASRSRRITDREDLTRFFPAVPDALPGGITTDVVDAARTGGVVPGCDLLDFGDLSEGARTAVADALNGWRLLGLTPVEGRSNISVRPQLLPGAARGRVRVRRADEGEPARATYRRAASGGSSS